MNLKEEYNQLIETIKRASKKEGVTLRNEDIAAVLGYNRSYFSTLMSYRGKVTPDHIKLLKLNYSSLLEKETSERIASTVTKALQHQESERTEKLISSLERENQHLRSQNETNLTDIKEFLRVNQGMIGALYEQLVTDSKKDKALVEEYRKFLKKDS